MADLPLLEARDVTIVREGQTLIESVSLSLAPASIHLLIGPNGAGKSSLVSALLGQARFAGHIACHFRRSGKIAFVPQSLPVDRTLPVTVEELLATTRQRFPVCLGIRPGTREKIASLLDQVGLAHLASRHLGALSGGELRRVLLAHALDPEPELLLLDEPAAGLDQPSVLRMETLLRDLRERAGTTVLLVSHDIAQVRRLADRVTLLDRTVQREGTVAEVLGDRPFFPFLEDPSSAEPPEEA
ncbi:MAG: ATP-binding cassette domain-containing protein [Byssovorax sp.]